MAQLVLQRSISFTFIHVRRKIFFLTKFCYAYLSSLYMKTTIHSYRNFRFLFFKNQESIYLVHVLRLYRPYSSIDYAQFTGKQETRSCELVCDFLRKKDIAQSHLRNMIFCRFDGYKCGFFKWNGRYKSSKRLPEKQLENLLYRQTSLTQNEFLKKC